jgi:hypothetical protein
MTTDANCLEPKAKPNSAVPINFASGMSREGATRNRVHLIKQTGEFCVEFALDCGGNHTVTISAINSK